MPIRPPQAVLRRNAPLSDLLTLALDASLAGGAEILGFYGQEIPIESKADHSPLTKADIASHKAIVSRLSQGSNVPILSEEGDPEAIDRSGWNRFWCVDPLDGTKEFIKQTGEFTVNVALIEDGAPVLGVVHIPVKKTTYFAEEGVAYRQAEDGEPERIKTRSAGSESLTVVASRDHAGPEVAKIIDRIEADGMAVESAAMGSSLKFCLVAEGGADFYPRTGPTMEWDSAAPQAVVEAAGGNVFTADGRSLRYNKPVLRNPSMFTVGDVDIPWRSWIG